MRLASTDAMSSGVYRSGQTGQTVNLMALPSKVRILPRPLPHKSRNRCGISSFLASSDASEIWSQWSLKPRMVRPTQRPTAIRTFLLFEMRSAEVACRREAPSLPPVGRNFAHTLSGDTRAARAKLCIVRQCLLGGRRAFRWGVHIEWATAYCNRATVASRRTASFCRQTSPNRSPTRFCVVADVARMGHA